MELSPKWLITQYLLLIGVVFLIACTNRNTNSNAEADVVEEQQLVEVLSLRNAAIIKEIPTPQNYERLSYKSNEFGFYLENLPLDTIDDKVHLYNGQLKRNQDAQYAVIKMDVGKRDLQQCADAVMRLKAEHWYHTNNFDAINFMFTNGDWVDFNQYAQGYRPKVNGSKITWSKTQAEDFSYKTFRKYMDLVFTYAGTLSLSKQLKSVPNFEDIKIGDVLNIGGSPGHAVIVVDVAVHADTKEKIFMLAQSYMPAQEIHILQNFNDANISPWYKIPKDDAINTPEYYFTKQNLMRF